MVITPASQAGKGGSIPLTRSGGLCTLVINSPLGTIGIITQSDTLTGIVFAPSQPDAAGSSPRIAEKTALQLERYFDDPHWRFDLELMAFATRFQKKVWSKLRKLKAGNTVTYGELSRRLRIAGGARAVGNACAANPLPIIIPCHRVVAVNGLGGYCRTDNNTFMLEKKLWLLKHEGRQFPPC